MTRVLVQTSKAPAAIGPYSQAVIFDNWVFTSGQIPMDPLSGKLVTEDFSSQVHQVFKNLEAVLAEAGCNFHHVVKAVVFLSSLKNFETLNQIYSEYLGSSKPARSTVEVAGLPKGVDVEIELIAHK